MVGRRREPVRDPGATMQIDALVDDMEDVAPPPGTPPPLPPARERGSALVWIAGALVIVLAIGLAVGVGWLLFSADEPEPLPTPQEPPVIQMDEFVFPAE